MRKKANRLGERKYNNFGSEMIIIDYKNCHNVDIYFPEYNWTFYNTDYERFKKGNVVCPYEPFVYNVGYLGEGIYKPTTNGLINKMYDTWHSMIRRCYDEKSLSRNPTYKGCCVCNEWLNFQNFAEWFEQNYYEIEGETMNLDKDIILKNNKLYSPDTCVFVPQKINKLFVNRHNHRGILPLGVHMKNDGKYIARCGNGCGNKKHLGVFDTPEKAFKAYKEYKEKLIKDTANMYKNIIPYTLYEAMYKYEIEMYD